MRDGFQSRKCAVVRAAVDSMARDVVGDFRGHQTRDGQAVREAFSNRGGGDVRGDRVEQPDYRRGAHLKSARPQVVSYRVHPVAQFRKPRR